MTPADKNSVNQDSANQDSADQDSANQDSINQNSALTAAGDGLSMPPVVAAYLLAIATQNRALAYLQITPEGTLLSWGGELDSYGLKSLETGDYVGDHLFFLEGFFPLTQPHEVLSGLQAEPGLVVDVHMLLSPISEKELVKAHVSSAVCGWVLLLDGVAEYQRQRQLQQQGNDLSLLKAQVAKMASLSSSHPSENGTNARLPSFLPAVAASSPPVAGPPVAGPPVVGPISLLLTTLYTPDAIGLVQNSHRANEERANEEKFSTLNTAFSRVSTIIREEGGIMNHILGKTSVSIFGLTSDERLPAHQAIFAARRLLPSSMVGTGIGMAITTGEATVGTVSLNGEKKMNPVGLQVQRLFSLSTLVRPETVVLDQATYREGKGLTEDGVLVDGQCSFSVRPFVAHRDPPGSALEALELYQLTLH